MTTPTIEFTVFEKATGRVFWRGVCQPEMLEKQAGGDEALAVIEGYLNPATTYVANGAAVSRPAPPIAMDRTMIAADGIDAATITGVPDGATITVGGSEQTVTGGTVTIRSRAPTAMEVTIQHWPHLDWTATVEAA